MTSWRHAYLDRQHAVKSRPTSQKTFGVGFLYGVYKPQEWLGINSYGENGN